MIPNPEESKLYYFITFFMANSTAEMDPNNFIHLSIIAVIHASRRKYT